MKNLLIVFPGGCGGNHLANLISLNNKFTPLFKSNDYHNDMLNHYKKLINYPIKTYMGGRLGIRAVHGVKAHFSEYHHLDQLYTEQGFDQILNNKTINILMGHNHCFQTAESKGLLITKLPEKSWIVMSYPKENSLPYKRINLYQFNPRPEVYTFPFYIKETEPRSELAYADESNGIFIDTEKFFLYGCEYINEELTKFNIELPALAQELHEIWMNKITEVLNFYETTD